MSHKNLSLNKIHPPHKQEFVNAAQRLAMGGFISSDLYKWAVDLDTYHYNSLVSISPITQEPVFLQEIDLFFVTRSGSPIYTNNNTTIQCPGAQSCLSILNVDPKSSGKQYVEFRKLSGIPWVGLVHPTDNLNSYASPGCVFASPNESGGLSICPTNPSRYYTGNSFTLADNDIIALAFDRDLQNLKVYKNNTLINNVILSDGAVRSQLSNFCFAVSGQDSTSTIIKKSQAVYGSPSGYSYIQ